VQGQDNWRYGFYDGPFGSADFQEMTQCIPEGANHAWWVNPQLYWTSIRKEISYPNGPASCGRQPVEHWAVRRWVSEVDGTVTITGVLEIVAASFDGFTGHILVDGNVVFSQLIGALGPVAYTQSVAVTVGSVVDFAIQPNGSDCNDWIKFSAVISSGVISSGAICDIQLNQASFGDTDRVIAQVFRFANSTAGPLPVEFKVWFEVPGVPPIVFARGGADGSVVLPPGFDVNAGPFTLFTVSPPFPRGNYAFNCRLLHPVTGALLAEDLNPFVLQ
jgi:hypothetical protein